MIKITTGNIRGRLNECPKLNYSHQLNLFNRIDDY